MHLPEKSFYSYSLNLREDCTIGSYFINILQTHETIRDTDTAGVGVEWPSDGDTELDGPLSTANRILQLD